MLGEKTEVNRNPRRKTIIHLPPLEGKQRVLQKRALNLSMGSCVHPQGDGSPIKVSQKKRQSWAVQTRSHALLPHLPIQLCRRVSLGCPDPVNDSLRPWTPSSHSRDP